MTRVDSSVLLMDLDPDRYWITDPDPDHPKGMYAQKMPKSGCHFVNKGTHSTLLIITEQ